MRILISGLLGYMGQEVAALAERGCRGAELVGGVDCKADGTSAVPCTKDFSSARSDVDCVIDFSHHSVTHDLLDFVVSHHLPLVLATTGQTEEERSAIFQAAEQIPLFFAANYSLGIALLIALAKKTAQVMPDAEIEIIEKHHNRKVDAPSGTALTIAEELRKVRKDAELCLGRSGQKKRTPNEIGIHAIRMGNIVGEHEVMIGTPHQTIILKHEAHDRALFAEGALAAAEFLCGKPNGLYEMKDLVSFG